MTNEEFYNLYQFLGAYFHQDWMSEFSAAEEVVGSYLKDSDAEVLIEVEAEIKSLLALDVEEDVLRGFILRDLGCCYCYWLEWGSGKAWLKQLLSWLKKTDVFIFIELFRFLSLVVLVSAKRGRIYLWK